MEFKVGDWVRHLINNNIFQIIRKDIIDDEDYDLIYFNTDYDEEDCIHVFNGEIFQSEQYELWKPQVGEWCWFKNKLDEIYSLAKFEAGGIYNPESAIKTIQLGKHGNSYWDTCEPFIGKFPSHLIK